MAKPRTNDAETGQMTMCFVPEVVPMGDGSYRILPGKPRTKLSVKEAARVVGLPVGRIYELYHHEMIDGERPTPRRILIYAESLTAHLSATRDREHWSPERKKRWRRTK